MLMFYVKLSNKFALSNIDLGIVLNGNQY